MRGLCRLLFTRKRTGVDYYTQYEDHKEQLFGDAKTRKMKARSLREISGPSTEKRNDGHYRTAKCSQEWQIGSPLIQLSRMDRKVHRWEVNAFSPQFI